MTSITKNEPAAIVGIVTSVASATLALFTVFGLQLEPEQQVAIIGFLVVLAPLVQALWTRLKVTPVAKAEKAVAAARVAGKLDAYAEQREDDLAEYEPRRALRDPGPQDQSV